MFSAYNSIPIRYILRPSTGSSDCQLDSPIMGCSTRLLSAGVYWSPRCCYLAGSQSRRSVFGNFRLVHTILSSLSCPKRLPGEDLAINLWDIGSGKRVKKMTGHTFLVYSLAFSAGSSLLVSGGCRLDRSMLGRERGWRPPS